MNLRPVPIENIPLGKALSWRIYDRNGYIVFARGEMVGSREQIKRLEAAGLMQDIDEPVQTRETGDWVDLGNTDNIFPPTGIKPQIGEFVQIHLPNQHPHAYHSARLIGYIRNVSLLLTRPAGLLPVEGDLVEMRMVTGSNIYVFQAAIQRLCIAPALYMHLDYPLEVRMQKLRKSPWARVNLGVTVTDSEGARIAARTVNLSSEGAQLLAYPELGKAGDRLHLSLPVEMDELKSTLNLNATILHLHQPAENQQSNLFEYGVSFNDVAAEVAVWLKALVYRHIAEGDIA